MEEIEKGNERKIAIVFHHDIDGISSSALVLRALGHAEIFVSHDPNEPFPDLFVDEAYIVDIALTEKTWGSLKNIHASRIIWIDHHKPGVDVQNLSANVQLVLEPASPSAVRLVRQYFNLNDEIAEKIVDLGTKADTWVLEPLVQQWMDLDSAYSFKKRDKTPLILALANGKLEITGRLRRTLDSYLRKKELAKKKLLEHTVVREIKGHSVAVGLSPALLSGSESADILLKQTNSEIQIILKYQGWMSFRRAKNSTVNLLEIAKLFGGGGHEYASGATLGKKVTSRNFTDIAEEILEKISLVL